MPIKPGLKTTLNKIRELSSDLYQEQVPIVTDDLPASQFGAPILEYNEIKNEFLNNLINRIVYTQFLIKYFKNPLKGLEGDRIPLGSSGQEIYINPAKGRHFNSDDFIGLLAKYEADVKVQYTNINADFQYPVTIGRQQLKQAFVTWSDLETFIDQITSSLYTGAYIDEYNMTKQLISNAYRNNNAIIEKVNTPTDKDTAAAFVKQARSKFLKFQSPSTQFNSWYKLGGYGRPITTFTDPKDIVFIINADFQSLLDVDVLANAFNIDKTVLLGNIITVDNFDIYDEDGNVIFDGSKIIGFMGDRAWFRIKQQDMFMDTFYNPNNRTWQYYLNIIKMYNYSLFANGIIFATELPTGIFPTNITTSTTEIKNGLNNIHLNITPVNFTEKITATVDTANTSHVAVSVDGDKLFINVKSTPTNPVKITLTSGEYTTIIDFNYKA